ncbi:ABC transporter ATP-binding protein [Bosea sp. (in: a-proteobacteria)]|uniref:nickel ABC transporter ATP-binding protein NikE n=1 Tax=Bosea sp. (in: a-proteobacteria) TaxID=1871050 RepID=UPI002638D38B|nr:ABC transporter ATP-binding protein [Bosea sp. (in: a-proteobacteria)]MCO5092584.1 ABC transporter ATP-binding protein [Bosea sp. (in: a-proteobacteria)]
MTAALSIRNYGLAYAGRFGTHQVLKDISFDIAAGEVVGLVGESGSGKSSLAWAIMRYLPRNAREAAGSAIKLRDTDLCGLSDEALTSIRGSRMSMVFQDPATALNPTLTIGRQITEVLVTHRGMSEAEAWAAGAEALTHVELRDVEGLMRRYPHQASGGEKQRVIIATAFACRPELIVFDEPTTALDVITGARILELFRRLRDETGVAALYISHDLALVSRVADRVLVLEKGDIVEEAPAKTIFRQPQHPYTRRLVDAVPRPDHRLIDDAPAAAPLLAVKDLQVWYQTQKLFAPAPKPVTSGATLDVRKGEILGLVGESGSGKSSVARAMTGLASFTGEITLDGVPISARGDLSKDYRRRVQIIFQHPDSSLNPRQTVAQILSRPLKLYGGDVAEIPALLEQVRLPADYGRRYPHQLSGGEKQRVAIARAFAAKPELIICDEITAPLDVSVQASVIELLISLRRRYETAYLFITHDLNLVRQIAHRIAVMRDGDLIDLVSIAQVNGGEVQPYTRELMAASPAPVG